MKGLCILLATVLCIWPVTGQQFINPVLWEDLADLDIFRVDDAFYYSASTMHYSPGAPILRSYDLVNWEYLGHSVPTLDFGTKYDLVDGQSAYVKGIYASTMRYRASNGLFYWIGCIESSQTYIYTASAITGPWTKRATIATCYYDAGLLVDDDDDSMYVAYGNTQISVAELSSDGLSQVKTQMVYDTPSDIGVLEGSRMYKINGAWYIFVTRPANGQYVLRSTSGPFGPYTIKELLLDIGSPIAGGGVPHQGGMVQTPNGDWYYMAFVDSYPGGRVPVLAPITWGSDGFPVLTTVNGNWASSYDYPLPEYAVRAHNGTDVFPGPSLGPEWEWNHNPDTSKSFVGDGAGLTLSTATVTSDLYGARNTLTHRILGPTSSGTIVLRYADMADGDRAGLALLRDTSAWIGVQQNRGSFRVSMWSGLTMTSTWTTASTGFEVAGAAVTGGLMYLRIYADIEPGSGRQARFYYSTDGSAFTELGSLVLNNAWQFFLGYRYAIFNHATAALGGSVSVSSFTVDTPGRTVS
ncbi:xylosidase glycosyl hydrolase [Phlyctema vagabunda]|uniref:Xylosidase glycosyl hydrolase n=1 Tax=Phlyctema vagabunda TaxID=108571 RepID=A0ABR4PLD5_9HELO